MMLTASILPLDDLIRNRFIVIVFLYIILAGYIVLTIFAFYQKEQWKVIMLYLTIIASLIMYEAIYRYQFALRYLHEKDLNIFLWWDHFPFVGRILFLGICCFILVYGVHRVRSSRKEKLTLADIREAIDNLDDAILIAREDGMAVLTNRKMYALVKRLTGSTSIDANALWNTLEMHSRLNDVEGNRDLYLNSNSISFAGEWALTLEDGSVWQFSKNRIENDNVKFIHIVGIDVTKEWHLSKELEAQNDELDKKQAKLQVLLQDVAQIRQKEERLDYKIRVHAWLGSAMLKTKLYLSKSSSREEQLQLLDTWKVVINGLRVNLLDNPEREDAMQELIEVASEMGCEIEVIGEVRTGHPIVLAAVRESLSNAVRHAHATKLIVRGHDSEAQHFIVISDDGDESIACLTEGDGLRSLRKKVETAGGTMIVTSTAGVKLSIHLPIEEEIW